MPYWLPLPEMSGFWVVSAFYTMSLLLGGIPFLTSQRIKTERTIPFASLAQGGFLAKSHPKTPAMAKLGGECLLAVWLVHGLFALALGLQQGYSLVCILVFAAWLCGAMALWPAKSPLSFLRRMGAVLGAIMLLLAALWSIGTGALGVVAQVALQQGKAPLTILSLHIIAAVSGTCLVGMAGLLSAAYLWLDWRMKLKHPLLFGGTFSLKILEHWGNQTLRWGFVGLALSVLLGFTFAKASSWEHWLSWRRLGPLGVLCVYAAVLFAYDVHLQRGTKPAFWRTVCALALGAMLSIEIWLVVHKGDL